MLPIYIISKYNVRSSCGVLFQRLNTSVRWCSSSDSSDSDSDTEKMKQKKSFAESTKPATSESKNNDKGTLKVVEEIPITSFINIENTKTATTAIGKIDLNELVNRMLKARKSEKIIDVAIQPKKKEAKKVKPLSYEKQLRSAAENVADKLGGDKTKTTIDLLKNVIQYKDSVEKKDKSLIKNIDQYKAIIEKRKEQLQKSTDSTKSDASIMEYMKSKRFAKSRQSLKNEEQKSFTDEKSSQKKSIIRALLQNYKEKKQNGNISQQLLQSTKTPVRQPQNNVNNNIMNNVEKPFFRQDLDIWNGVRSKIFEDMGDVSPDTPELKTWTALEQNELKALTIHPPANIFQEMILWTEQGKLWKFPIDNEQGMEEEQNIHFSEHVFTERYLKGWCPTSGPIRHFMELVCVGLSKNPYMTVQEKINHIMWYRDYFKSKEELLQELGVIKEPFPDTAKQITQ